MMEAATLDSIRAHAQAHYPKEICGVLIVSHGHERYMPCRNRATDATREFIIDPVDYAAAEDLGEIIAIVHSHPNASPLPSDADRYMCEATGLEWHILSWPGNELHSFQPSGWQAPLVGRQFFHGTLDCYGLIRDYYQRELGIILPDFHRDDDWWKTGKNLYVDFFKEAGFRRVEDLKKHDVLLLQIRSPVPNHGAIFIDPERNWILQHLHGRLSAREVYAGYWRKITFAILRHNTNPT